MDERTKYWIRCLSCDNKIRIQDGNVSLKVSSANAILAFYPASTNAVAVERKESPEANTSGLEIRCRQRDLNPHVVAHNRF